MKIHQSPLFVAVAIFSVLLGGCIPSLRPVYTEGDLVFEKALLGAWQPSDGSSRWEFAPGVGKSYRFTFTDKDGVSSEFEAHLARFDDLTYLDLQPTEKGITGNAFYKAYTLRLHTFFARGPVGRQPSAIVEPRWFVVEQAVGRASATTAA